MAVTNCSISFGLLALDRLVFDLTIFFWIFCDSWRIVKKSPLIQRFNRSVNASRFSDDKSETYCNMTAGNTWSRIPEIWWILDLFIEADSMRNDHNFTNWSKGSPLPIFIIFGLKLLMLVIADLAKRHNSFNFIPFHSVWSVNIILVDSFVVHLIHSEHWPGLDEKDYTRSCS